MNRYQPKAPRAAFGFAALVMTALTVGLAVVVPVQMSPGTPEVATLLAAEPATQAATEVLIVPARIEVIGVRESTVAGGAPAAAPVKHKRNG